MARVRIWDLPVRMFHWLLAAAFLLAFGIATLTDSESQAFPLHALLGLFAVFAILLRVVWGFIGSRWARFGSLDIAPSSLFRYLREASGLAPATSRAGHNPATSWFFLATVVIIIALGLTGFSMARGNESAKEVHEVLAWSMLVLAGVHVAGIVWHRLRQRECIAASMVTGYKIADANAAIPSARPWSAIVLLLLLAAWGTTLASGFDGTTGRLTLPLLNGSLQLRESEDERRADHAPQNTSEHDRDEETEDND